MYRRLLLAVLLLVPLAGFSDGADLVALGRQLGLDDPGRFAETVRHICREGRLPDWYLTKAAARQHGWQPGRDLCAVAPGHALGGDRFGNREGLLPDRPGRVWFEADLDYACGRRGARRLVFSNDRLVYVTLDHYRSFEPVPCPDP